MLGFIAVVNAVNLLARDEQTIGDYFNVGGIGETTIQQLADKVVDKTSSNSEISYTPYDEAYPVGYEDMQRRVPDISKIKKALGWEPEKTLDMIIDDVAREMTK